ncbi:7TM-DISM domain-containing protein [Bacterioplanoides sp.]|uniref:7TM-DISM domain-containing protein n=1 Tax=Bacterioplanoides sp. TaxID=2066072 RepID=UPI003B5A1B6C
MTHLLSNYEDSRMVTGKFYLLLLVVLALLCFSSSSQATNPVLIPNQSFDYGVTPYASVYEDKQKQLTIREMLSPEQQLRFTPSHSEKLKFGLTTSAYWLRISISNPYKDPKQAVLSLSNPDLKQVSLYNINNPEPQTYSRKSRGRIGGYIQAYPFLIDIPAESTESFLIRIASDSILNTELRLASLDYFLFNEQWDFIIQGLVLGWVLGTLLYFLNLYRQQRLLVAAAAASYCLCALMFLPSWTGLLSMLFTISGETLAYFGYIMISLSASAHGFVVYSLGWRQRHIEQKLMIAGAIYLVTNLIIVAVVESGMQFFIALSLLLYGLATSIFLMLVPSKELPAQRWLTYGALALTIGLILTLLTTQNLLTLEFLHDWAILILPSSLILSMVATVAAITDKRTSKHNAAGNELQINAAMLSHISHELRSPINGVLGMSQLLNDTPLGNNQRDFLNTISEAGHDLLHVVNQVSDLGKVQSNQLELEPEPVEIRKLLNQTVQHFQQGGVRKQMELVIDIDDQVANRVIVDRTHLQSLIHSILAKLLAYGEHGVLTLAAQPYNSQMTSGLMLQLRVNSQLARPDELRSALQILQHHKPQQRIGDFSKQWNMLVLRKVMKRMKATLEIEDFNLHGASLTLYLPLESDQQPVLQSHDDSLIGLRVLIVDDNASVRNVIEKQLRRQGMRAESTYSGKEALAMMRHQNSISEPYEVLIIDHDMPLMDGLQLSERVLSDPDISNKPARLMLTGMNISNVREEALDAGIQQLLAKPADPDQLRRTISGLLAARAKERS